MELESILESIDDPIETIIVAIGCLAMRMVMYPMEMIMYMGDFE